MIYEKLLKKYGYNVPIFSSEILKTFSSYSKVYVFRILKKEEEQGKISRLYKGVYYIPTKTIVGPSSISASETAEKRYVKNKNKVFGIYSGYYLEHSLGLTTQIPTTREIVTNNEATRKRKVNIAGSTFIIRKSRTKITKENEKSYIVLQALSEFYKSEDDKEVLSILNNYIKENNVEYSSLKDLAPYFPKATQRKLERICAYV